MDNSSAVNNIMFLGSFFEKSGAEAIWKNSKGAIVVSGDTFQQALIEGLQVQTDQLTLVTLPAIGSFPKRYRKPWFKGCRFGFEGKNTCGSFLNLPMIKQCGISMSSQKHVMRWAKSVNGSRIIIVYALFPSYIKAAVKVKKRFPSTEICSIVLDLPEYFDDHTSALGDIVKRLEQKSLERMLPFVDKYVLLTDQMTEALKIAGKPTMIMEGLYSTAVRDVDIQLEKSPKTILYTGKLDARFGITELLEAFGTIADPDYRLWICGDGTARVEVEYRAAADTRIIYFGNVKREEALRKQLQATILINPRKGNEEYTKYSFPSKTMEYMASGTVTMMYPLPGMPQEYYPYVALVPGNTIGDLADTIVEWCEKPSSELAEFGNRAKRFILDNKNATVQAKRLIDFLITTKQ